VHLRSPRPRLSSLRRVANHLRRLDIAAYWTALALCVLAWVFLGIAEATHEPRLVYVERELMLLLRKPGAPHEAIGPSWLTDLWRDVTALGSVTVVTLTTLAVVGYLALSGLWRTAFVVVLAASGAGVLSSVLKATFQRARPDAALHFVEVTGASFPSGHTLAAAVMYPTLGALVAGVTKSRQIQIYVLCLALAASVLVGFSRVFLGVHYPSDVAAGLSVGFAWSIVCYVVLRALQRRGALRDPKRDPGPR
jgi:undecaprenyl-diphosphatase